MKSLTVAAASTRNIIGQADQSIEIMKRWVGTAKEKCAELNITGYIPAAVANEIAETIPGHSTEKIITIAREADIIIGCGIIERERHDLFCTHVMVDKQGIIGKQREIHVPAHEQPFWKAGDAITVLNIGKAKVGIAICRDAFFDEEVLP